MEIFKEIGPFKAFLKAKRTGSVSVGFVPTMGALHDGHLALIQASRAQNHVTVCSIFVNPTQFNNPADLAKYPRTLEQDLSFLEQEGCDVVFAPEPKEMYERTSNLKFDFGQLDKILEGKYRPGHFSGVALVVSKLFNIVGADRVYFGQKDFQQFKIISRLTEELKFDHELICLPTVREKDGLAMSSRNKRLHEHERKKAIIFYENLLYAKNALLAGKPWNLIRQEVQKKIETTDVKLEYFELADRENLSPIENVTSPDHAILLIAGFVGDVRLIDNLYV